MTAFDGNFKLRMLSARSEFYWLFEIALFFLVKSAAIAMKNAIDSNDDLNYLRA